MPIEEYQIQKIHNWLIEIKRKCPYCQAGAENLIPYDITEAFPEWAATEHGIDTSETVYNAQVRCQNCRAEMFVGDLESLKLY